MHALKILTFLILTSFASFSSCSFDYEESFEMSFDRTNIFFSAFSESVTVELQRICSQLAPVNELSSICPTILEFPKLASEQLFSDFITNSCDENIIYNSFLDFFNQNIGIMFDKIRYHLNSNDVFEFDIYIQKYCSDLKDAIFSSVKCALDAVNASGIQKPISKPNDYFIGDDDDFKYLDDISAELLTSVSSNNENLAPKTLEVEDSEDIMNSSHSDSSKQAFELTLEALSVLFYGIHSGHNLFPIAIDYLRFIQEHGLKTYDPNLIFTDPNAQSIFYRNFEYSSPAFLDFCNYIENRVIPITSPLYNGPAVSKSKISEVRKSVLTKLAVEKMQSIFVTFNIEEMIKSIQIQHPEIDYEIIECFIDHIKTKAYEFLLTLHTEISYSSEFKEIIETACNQISEVLCTSFGPDFNQAIVDAFLKLLKDPLTLIKRYDSLEDWKSLYDESSPKFKRKLSSPEDGSNSSGRKSVKIVEANNEICHIKSVADIEREFVEKEKENIPSLRRSPSSSFDLNQSIGFPSSLAIFEDNTRVVKNFGPSSTLSKILSKSNNIKSSTRKPALPLFTNDSSVFENAPKPAPKFSNSEVPDFPFHNPSEIVEFPDYITSTFDYLLEQGDNSCFVLGERIDTIKEGISTFLSKSFEDKHVADSVMHTIENSLKKIFDL